MIRSELKENIRGGKAAFLTEFGYSRDGEKMTFEFTCHGSQRFSAYETDNCPIYEGDVCEIFLAESKNRHHYYEFEVAPNGTVFCAWVQNDPETKKRTLKMLPKIIESAVHRESDGYSVRIIFSFQNTDFSPKASLCFNAYRIETVGGTKTHLLALNPTFCETFHVPEAFIDL
jgi:hypothetical protein